MQVDTSPASEMEIRKIGFLKRHKTLGSGGLSFSFFKDSDEVWTSKFTKLLGLNWTKRKILRNGFTGR